MVFVTYPLFTLLAKYNHTMVISWLYVFTMVMVITFAIEIGQWFSGTGTPDINDMASGVAGFLIMFLIFAVIRAIFRGILRLFHGDAGEAEREKERQVLRAESERMRNEKQYKHKYPDKPLRNTNAYRTSSDIADLKKKGRKAAKKKINLAELAHGGGASIRNLAAGGKALLEDLAGEIAEERSRTEEIPIPVPKADNTHPAGTAEGDDRITYIMQSPAEAEQMMQEEAEQDDRRYSSLDKEDQAEYDDVASLFAEFDRAAAEEDLAAGQRTKAAVKKKSEQNASRSGKQPDISERPVYKEQNISVFR